MFFKRNLSNIYYMTQLYEIKVGLSPNQKKNLSRAYRQKETIILRLSKDSLTGGDTLYVPSNIVKRLDKNRKLKKGMDIKLSKTNIRKQIGGSLLSTILSVGRTFGPTLAKTLGLSALAGAASEGASQIVKKISGRGQTGGFLLPYENIEKILQYSRVLTDKQAKDIYHAMQTGSGVHITPTKEQRGGFLGTLLAGIAAPLVIDALKGLTRSGAPQLGMPKRRPPRSLPKIPQLPTAGYRQSGKQDGGLVLPRNWRSPPVFGNWPDQTMGAGKKKNEKKKKNSQKRQRSSAGKKQSIQKRPIVKHFIVKPKFHKNIPMSNFDLLNWCKYLNIPINDVLSRDQNVPHNHIQALFIYNLEPSYMSGSHWVATYVEDGVINYFDSFGLPPFQEIVNHAKKKNLTLLHQNDQIQNIMTTTCGYFCLYFLNEMNKGKTYFDLLKVFDIHDTIKNEKFIERYFKKI